MRFSKKNTRPRVGVSKSERAEITRRVMVAFKILVAGGQYEDVVHYASSPPAGEEQWGVSERMIRTYISRANRRLEACAQVVQRREFGLAVRQLKDLYFAARRAGDLAEALRVRKQLSELEGLEAARKLELSGPAGGPIKTQAVPVVTPETVAEWRKGMNAAALTPSSTQAAPAPTNGNGQQ